MAILTRYDTIVFLVPLAAALLWGMGPARRTRPVVIALGTLALFCVQSWLHQQFVAPFYQPLGGLVGGFLAVAALLVPAFLLVRRTAVWRRLGAAALRRETALRVAAAACLFGWVLFGWFVRPRLAGQGRVGRLFRQLVGEEPHGPGSRSSSPAPSPSTCSTWSTFSGAVGLLVAVAGVAALVVARRKLWETAWLAASLARPGGLHAQRFSRPLPDVGEPAVRPGGHAARQRRGRRRRRVASPAPGWVARGSSAGRASPSSRRSSGSTPAPPALWRAGASGPA